MDYFLQSQTEYERKLALVALLFKLVYVDIEVHPDERRMVFDMGKRLGLTDDQITDVEKHKATYAISAPADEQQRMTILYHLLFLMKVDKDAAEEEMDFIRRVAFRLGFRADMVEDLIKVIIENIGQEVPVMDMLNNIRKYLN